MSYHPDQRFVTAMTTIRRYALLPEEALGSVSVQEGARVDQRDVVAHGALPSRHLILDAARFLRLRKPEQLDSLMLVKVGEAVNARQPLAGKSATRGRRLLAPARGLVAHVGDGRIILREMPQLLDLEAGVRGRVVEIQAGRGVVIETIGALVQGVWGNNRRVLATLRLEPEEGVENITQDSLEMQYVGVVVVTRRPLRRASLRVMREQGFSGIIAPTMASRLRDEALQAEGAILLTEGFGSARMSNLVYSLLSDFDKRQVTVDALTPTRWDSRRPEVIINLPAEQRPPGINPMLSVQRGLMVRATRAPHAGSTGKVVDLPKSPVLLDNGLRVPCAQVEFISGETAFVPLANLEYYGK